MFGKQLTSLVLSSLMAVSLFCTPVMNMTAYAAEETPGAIITDNNISLEHDGEIIEEEQNDEGTPEAVLEESDSTDDQEAEEQGTDELEEDELGNDGQDEIDDSTTSADVDDETDSSESLPEENNEETSDLGQNIDNPDQTVDPITEEAAPTEVENEASEEGLENQDEYVCGDNLQWNYNGIDTITISGTGSMYGYSQGDSPFSGAGNVSKIVIENGVTSIGQNAFYGMITVNTVSIPDSVTQIGEDAFTMCDSLAEIYYTGTLNEWSNIEGGEFCNDLSVIIHATDGVSGSNVQLLISECVIDELSSMTYTGEALTQTLSIRNGDKVLIADTDYTVDYANNINAGTATVIITGQGAYTDSVEKPFTIAPKKITPTVTISNKTCTYNGKNRNPAVTVKYGSIELKKDQDYTVRYATNCSAVGTYNAAVTLKGNYSGSGKASYTILPKPTSIYNVVGSKDQFVVKWTKQTEQVTGYQIQYSQSSKFESGNKTITITKNTEYIKTIKKPAAGKEYYVRLRTYKNVGDKKYYSTWSATISTVVKRTLNSKETRLLYSTRAEEIDSSWKSYYSFNFKITNRMIVVMPVSIKIYSGNEVFSGGVRITLKNANGKVYQNDSVNLKTLESDEVYENWFYNDDEVLLPPGEYTYTIKNTSDCDLSVDFNVIGFSKKATSASMKSSVTVKSGDWVKIGKITEGTPVATVTYTKNGIINSYSIESDGSIYVLTDKKGTINVTTKLSGGKKYTTKVNVTAGEPDFMAYVTGYNTRDNYFTVKIKNLRKNNLTIIRKGGKVEDVDYKSYDRWIRDDGNVVVKYGETKTVRFYLKGSTTWYDYRDFTLFAKFVFEGKTYEWHVWGADSVLKKGNKWFKTYWDQYMYDTWS